MTLPRKQIWSAVLIASIAWAPALAFAQTPPPLETLQPPPEVAAPVMAPAPDQQPPRTPQPGRTPTPPPPPPGMAGQPGPPLPPPQPGQSVNVKIDLTITDEGGAAAPLKKVVSMTIADREFGQIRSTAFIPGSIGEVPLNVDVRPSIQTDGKLRVQLSINYDSTDVPAREGATNPRKIMIREQLGFIVENGKPLVVSQSADPLGDRKVTVEVKATILR